MEILDFLKLAADWSLAAVMAGVLVYVIRSSVVRQAEAQEDLVGRLIAVVDKNTQALAEIKPALDHVARFMEAVETRLLAIEERLERIANRAGETF